MSAGRTASSARWGSTSEKRRYRLPGFHGAPIHLHDAEPAEGRSAAARDPARNLAVVPAGREDRRPRSERRREVVAPADHGGPGPGFRPPGAAGPPHPP